MRPSFVKTAIALVIGASIALPEAYSADWNGSYSASGQCFCVGDLPLRTARQIVPTPVGGQSVEQVCQRLGGGPGLLRRNGLFNHPVYKDAQCGHGPGLASVGSEDACSGSLDGVGADSVLCRSRGPRWDIQATLEAAPDATRVEVDAPVATHVPVYVTSPAGFIGKPIGNAAGAMRVSLKRVSADRTPPEGSQWVVIDGARFLRAREGVPAAGGRPGERIILDGFVYLRDDGTINPADIYLDKAEDDAPGVDPGPNTAGTGIRQEEADEGADQAAAARQLKERQQAIAARQRREDVRATARQIEAQRRRLRQEQLTEQSNRQRLDEQELARTKRRLEAASASRAQAALEARAKAQARDQASGLQAEAPELAVDTAQTPPSSTDNTITSPSMAAARPSPSEEESREAVDEASRQVLAPVLDDAEPDAVTVSESAHTSVSSALRLPAAVRPSGRNFRYLEALPVSYDVGGNGVMLEGSTSSHSRLQYFGSLGVTRQYNEIMAGAGYYLTPESASRLTLVLLAGIEYGNFELVDGQSPEISVDYDDTGVYLAASSRMVLNDRFELKAGVGYSSIFEGDAMVFGGGYLHLTRKLDLVTRFELGDNDLLGIGVRYYY